MGPSEITVNAYVVYPMLGVIILLAITMLGLLLLVLHRLGRIDARLANLQRILAECRQEFANLHRKNHNPHPQTPDEIHSREARQ